MMLHEIFLRLTMKIPMSFLCVVLDAVPLMVLHGKNKQTLHHGAHQ